MICRPCATYADTDGTTSAHCQTHGHCTCQCRVEGESRKVITFEEDPNRVPDDWETAPVPKKKKRRRIV